MIQSQRQLRPQPLQLPFLSESVNFFSRQEEEEPIVTDRLSLTMSSRPRISPAALALQLYRYHVRMFPVWPVVKVEEIVTSLSTMRRTWRHIR